MGHLTLADDVTTAVLELWVRNFAQLIERTATT